MKPTLAIDFDGTLCDFAYPGIGKVKEGAREALIIFKRLGYRILIYSCRTCSWHEDVFGGGPALERDRVKEMIAWLLEHDIPFDEVDDGTKGKPLAELYVDDKGVRFEDNWPQIAAFVTFKTLGAA